MRAVVLQGHGGFDQLSVRDDIPVPTPGAHEVPSRSIFVRPQFDAIGYQLPLDPLADQWLEELLRIRLSWVWVPPYSRLVPLSP